MYGFLAPTPEQPRAPGEWQNLRYQFSWGVITLVQNGHTIIDNKGIPGITGGALDSHEEGSEKGHVLYSKIVLTPAEKSSN